MTRRLHPVLITNTGSVGTVHEAEIAYMTERHPARGWAFLPVVAETWDGNTVHALPYDRLAAVMAKYGRPIKTP